ncbi:MAG: indole-3-glycerol-phosphate synthase [Candidatus Aminicenantia bacterium]
MNFLEIIKREVEIEGDDEIKRIEPPLSLSDFIIKESGIIGEFKRGTPTKKFKLELIPEKIAIIYEEGGVSAISVVVEKKFFLTEEEDLRRIKNTVSIPVIQKGFILNESQIVRARNNGADSVLLIVRLLDKDKLRSLLSKCEELGMEPIVEVSSEEDIKVISDINLKIIGINNRDLNTLKVNLDKGERILSLTVKRKIGRIRIIESGLRNPEDLKRFKKAGADGFLIGGAFLDAEDMREKVREFVEVLKNDKNKGLWNY